MSPAAMLKMKIHDKTTPLSLSVSGTTQGPERLPKDPNEGFTDIKGTL